MYFKRFFAVFLGALSVYLYHYLFEENAPVPLEDRGWGKNPNETQCPPELTLTKFHISKKVVEDLKNRLSRTIPFAESLEGVNQRYGIHSTVLNETWNHWLGTYNWTAREPLYNKYPQYTVRIRGLKIHFLHVKPDDGLADENGHQVEVIPMLMVHGWPSTVWEFAEVIPLLTKLKTGKKFVFELVIPSLPGYVLSEASPRPGLSSAYIAQLFVELMDFLGYKQYYVQGVDWGSSVVQNLAMFYPERVLGLHVTMCFVHSWESYLKHVIGFIIPSLICETHEMDLCDYTKVSNFWMFMIEETGYFHMQATKPDTLGVSLQDSPMGLAAYMLEKYITLTNPEYRDLENGGLWEKISMDQVLDFVTIYWATRTMTSAMRIYAEGFTNFDLEFRSFNQRKILVPSGCTRFPHELALTPRSILELKFKNLIHLTDYKNGGHFAALEEPELFADDVYMFVEKVKNRYM